MLQNTPFTKKIIGYFSISITVLLLIFLSIKDINDRQINTSKWVDHTHLVILKNEKILRYAQELAKSARGYVIIGDETYLAPFEEASHELPVNLKELNEMTIDNPSQQIRIDKITQIADKYIDYGITLINTRRNNGFNAAYQIFKTGYGKRLMTELEQLILEVEAEEKLLLQQRRDMNFQILNKANSILLALEVLISLLLVGGFYAVYTNIRRRNKVETELKRKHNFITSIIENTPNPISIRDLSGNYILANSPFIDLFNKERKDIIGNNVEQIYPADVAKQTKEADEKVISGGETIVKEFKLPLPDGDHCYSAACFPLYDEDNNIYSIGTVSTDITELNKAKELLSINNNKLQKTIDRIQNILDASSDVICIINHDGIFDHLSSSSEKVFGYTASELTGKPFTYAIHPDDIEKTALIADKLMSGVTVTDFENRYIRKDGSIVHVNWTIEWYPAEKQFYCIAKDSTEKRETLKQLKEHKKNLDYAQKLAGLGSWEINLIEKRISVSDEFYNITGLTNEELGFTPEDYYKIVHPEDIPIVEKAFKNFSVQKPFWIVENRIIKPDKKIIFVEAKGEIVFNDEGEPIIVKGTLQDISQRKELEKEREIVIQELTKINEDLKQFSYITSHNFRAPLSNLIGILNILNYDLLDSYNKELIDLLKVSTHHLNDTINDLTTILLIKENHSINVEEVFLPDTLEKVVEAFAFELKEINAHINTDLQVELIKFNKVYFESILANLFSNAIKYRANDRKLEIHLHSYLNDQGVPCLTFSDNGQGINLKRHKQKVFGLYQRFHESIDGKGLGLFMVKTQVNALGGIIEINSEEGKGTSFNITFQDKKPLKIFRTEEQLIA